MKRTSKFLALILIGGLIYSIHRLYAGQNGSGLYDAIFALGYSSIILFICSFAILCFNIKRIGKHTDTIIFMLIGLPMTFMWVQGTIESMHYNRDPDLRPKYPLPVSREQFIADSIDINRAVDSLVSIRFNSDRASVRNTFIDTIVYSQKGDKVFVSYAIRFDESSFGADLYPGFLFADRRNSSGWQLVNANTNLGGNYHDSINLKQEVRRYYFNQFSFLDKDSTKKNFFWWKIMHPGD